jgi:CheY-like chemotaxis protein
MQILVIEDDDGVRQSLAAVLRDEGYDVEVALSGDDALDRLSRDPLPGLILLDLMMPKMDGATFRRHQLRDSRLARIPVVVVSARPDVTQLARAIGIPDVLRKPMSFEALIEVVRRRAGCEGGGVFTLEIAHDLLKRPD